MASKHAEAPPPPPPPPEEEEAVAEPAGAHGPLPLCERAGACLCAGWHGVWFLGARWARGSGCPLTPKRTMALPPPQERGDGGWPSSSPAASYPNLKPLIPSLRFPTEDCLSKW